jgi:maltoporin
VLQKVTIAPQITAGPGYFARPQLRVFATYANWNKDSGKIDGMNSRSNMSVGTQVEAWW